VILDPDMRVMSANRAFYARFGLDASKAEGSLFYELAGGRWDTPPLRRLLGSILPEKTQIEDYELTRDGGGSGPRTFLLNARRVVSLDGEARILLSIEDITDRKRPDMPRAP
jgi:PAS domain-containing protein